MASSIQYRLLVVLNILGIGTFAIVSANLDLDPNVTMFLSRDSTHYRWVADWLFHGKEAAQAVLIRPLLYPLLLELSRSIGGNSGILAMHFLFWLGTLNFTFLAIQKITKHGWLALAAAASIMINLSLIAITYHALSETTAAFLMAVFTWYLASHYKSYKHPEIFTSVVLLISLATLVKPLYYMVYLVLLLGVFPLFYLRSFLKRKRQLLLLFLAASPVLLQMSLVKYKYDQFIVSEIGTRTFDKFFFSQTYAILNDIPISVARDTTAHLKTADRLNYIFENLEAYYTTYKINLKGNIIGPAVFVSYPEGKSPHMKRWMGKVNGIYYGLHQWFPWLIVLLCLYYFVRDQPRLFLMLALLLPYGAVLLTSAFSFWQGDRLPLPVVPVWTTLYVWALYDLFTIGYRKLRSLNLRGIT